MIPLGCLLVLVIILSPSISISEGLIHLNQLDLGSKRGISKQESCVTGNPIFECWKCGSSWWGDHRQQLADCAGGFGKNAIGGKGGQILVVTDSSDKNLIKPKPGTLRHALIQNGSFWIIFSTSMKIKLSGPLFISSFKTIDGRGADVRISGKGCLMVEDVRNVIIHSISIIKCIPSESAYIRKNESLVKHVGKSMGNGISIIRSRNIWVDNCTFSDCTNELIDATLLSTALTFSNNLYFNKSELLLDRQDNNGLKQVTTEFNRFGKHLTNIPPSRNNGERGAVVPHSSCIGLWCKVKHIIIVTVLVVVSVIFSTGGTYWICKIRNRCSCGSGNSCCNCCNGNGIQRLQKDEKDCSENSNP